MELLKKNNQTYIHKGKLSIQTGCLGALHGEQREPNSTQQVWYVGIQDRILFGMV